jgi:uncharacterized protein YkwD
MSSRHLAEAINVALPRLILVAALSAICLCACSYASAETPQSPRFFGGPILAKAAANHSTKHRSHPRRCAKHSNFHASGHSRHGRHVASCSRRHIHPRPKALMHRKSSRHRNLVAHKHHHSVPAAANSSSCPNASLKPGPDNLQSIRDAVLCLINRERTDHGERLLQANGQLQQAAQNHTQDMVFGNYFEHNGPKGDTPLGRMRSAGYIYSSRVGYEVGENIGWGTLWLATPRAIVAAWMASPGHRANILDAHFHDTAIGVWPHPPVSLSHGQGGGIYTQDFGVIITG